MRTSWPCPPGAARRPPRRRRPTPGASSPRRPAVVGVGVLADEDDVDVADVIQFARTAFSHRDDRPAGAGSLALPADRWRRPPGAASSAASARSDRCAPIVGTPAPVRSRRWARGPVRPGSSPGRGRQVRSCRPTTVGSCRPGDDVVEGLAAPSGSADSSDVALQQAPGPGWGDQVVTRASDDRHHANSRPRSRSPGAPPRPVRPQSGRAPRRAGPGCAGRRRRPGSRQRPQHLDSGFGVPAEGGQIGGAVGSTRPSRPTLGRRDAAVGSLGLNRVRTCAGRTVGGQFNDDRVQSRVTTSHRPTTMRDEERVPLNRQSIGSGRVVLQLERRHVAAVFPHSARLLRRKKSKRARRAPRRPVRNSPAPG